MSKRQVYRPSHITATSESVTLISEDVESGVGVIIRQSGAIESIDLADLGQGPASEPDLILQIGAGGNAVVGPQPSYIDVAPETVANGFRITEPRRHPEQDTTDFPGCSPSYETLNCRQAVVLGNFSFPIRRGRLSFKYTPRVRMYVGSDWSDPSTGRPRQDVGRVVDDGTAPNTSTIKVRKNDPTQSIAMTPDFYAGGYLYLDKDLRMTHPVRTDVLVREFSIETPQLIKCATADTVTISDDYNITIPAKLFRLCYITYTGAGGYTETRQIYRHNVTNKEFQIYGTWNRQPLEGETLVINAPVAGANQVGAAVPSTNLRFSVVSNTADTITVQGTIPQAYRQDDVHFSVFKDLADPIIHGFMVNMPSSSSSPFMLFRTYYNGNYTNGEKILEVQLQNTSGRAYPQLQKATVQTGDLGFWVKDQEYLLEVEWDQPVNPGPMTITIKRDSVTEATFVTQSWTFLPGKGDDGYVTVDLFLGNRADFQMAEHSFPATNNMQGDMAEFKLYDLTNS